MIQIKIILLILFYKIFIITIFVCKYCRTLQFKQRMLRQTNLRCYMYDVKEGASNSDFVFLMFGLTDIKSLIYRQHYQDFLTWNNLEATTFSLFNKI